MIKFTRTIIPSGCITSFEFQSRRRALADRTFVFAWLAGIALVAAIFVRLIFIISVFYFGR
jgi:uncharacterized protein YhaN